MKADMELQRFARDKNGNFTSSAIKSYVDTRVIPSMGLNRSGLTADQQNTARNQARDLAIDILSNSNETTYRKQATSLRNAVVKSYDTYFAEAADRMALPGASKKSTFGDGQIGLARYVMRESASGAGRVSPVKSRGHADLILRDHFTRKVQGTPNATFTASASSVQRVAKELNGGRSVPDVASAYSIVRESGITSLRAPGEAPTTKRSRKPAAKTPSKRGLGAAARQSDLAKSIMKRKGFNGSYAEALAQAKREMNR